MKKWNIMVTLEVPRIGEYRHIGSALEAMDCLAHSWRGRQGRAYRRALSVCSSVLDGLRQPDDARSAFIAAAAASDIFIHH